MGHFGGNSGFDTPSMTPVPGGNKHVNTVSWGGSELAEFDAMEMPDGMPMMSDNLSVFAYSEMGDDEEAISRRKVCGVSMREILELNRDDVYDQRSPILFEVEMLSKRFAKKMGKEFCLNAAATKLIFVAGLQDKGCTLDNVQLESVHQGVEQFLPITEYDLPHAVARWITKDSTESDETSRTLRDDAQWEESKRGLPTYGVTVLLRKSMHILVVINWTD